MNGFTTWYATNGEHQSTASAEFRLSSRSRPTDGRVTYHYPVMAVKVYVTPTGPSRLVSAVSGGRSPTAGVDMCMRLNVAADETVDSLKARLHKLLRLPKSRSVVLYTLDAGVTSRIEVGSLDDYGVSGSDTLTLRARSVEAGESRLLRLQESLDQRVHSFRSVRRERAMRRCMGTLQAVATRDGVAARRALLASLWRETRVCLRALSVWWAFRRTAVLQAMQPGARRARILFAMFAT